MRTLVMAATLLAGAQELSEPLAAWKREIEAKGSGPIIVVRVVKGPAANTITVSNDTPERELVKQYLQQEDLVRQLVAAHALTVAHSDGDRVINLVLLNMERSAEWQSEDALLAHEFGHVWLKAMGYPAPRYVPGPAACLGTHTGNVVQHILLREELDRRGIDFRTSWIRDLQTELSAKESKPSSAMEPCQRVQQTALWLDVRLGLQEKDWAELPRYESTLRQRYPNLAPAVDEISAYLRKTDVHEPAAYREALVQVFERLKLAGVGGGMAALPLRR
jgi:hypothetical protein